MSNRVKMHEGSPIVKILFGICFTWPVISPKHIGLGSHFRGFMLYIYGTSLKHCNIVFRHFKKSKKQCAGPFV